MGWGASVGRSSRVAERAAAPTWRVRPTCRAVSVQAAQAALLAAQQLAAAQAKMQRPPQPAPGQPAAAPRPAGAAPPHAAQAALVALQQQQQQQAAAANAAAAATAKAVAVRAAAAAAPAVALAPPPVAPPDALAVRRFTGALVSPLPPGEDDTASSQEVAAAAAAAAAQTAMQVGGGAGPRASSRAGALRHAPHPGSRTWYELLAAFGPRSVCVVVRWATRVLWRVRRRVTALIGPRAAALCACAGRTGGRAVGAAGLGCGAGVCGERGWGGPGQAQPLPTAAAPPPFSAALRLPPCAPAPSSRPLLSPRPRAPAPAPDLLPKAAALAASEAALRAAIPTASAHEAFQLAWEAPKLMREEFLRLMARKRRRRAAQLNELLRQKDRLAPGFDVGPRAAAAAGRGGPPPPRAAHGAVMAELRSLRLLEMQVGGGRGVAPWPGAYCRNAQLLGPHA
jgi:hypothetical protein